MNITTTEEGELRTLSASQVNKLYNCSRMWAYEYIEKIKPPPSYPMRKGTFIHAVVEEFNEQLRSAPIPDESSGGREDYLRSRILEIARELWKDGLTGDFEDEFRDDHQNLQSQFYNYIASLLKRHRDLKRRTNLSEEDAWKRAFPSANELSVLVTDTSGDWMFRGAIDAVYEKHPLWFDRTALIDYKTGKSPFSHDSPMSVKYSRQLKIYAWMYYQVYGVVPEVTGIHFLAEKPSSATAFVFQEIDPGTIESTHLLLQRVREKATSHELEDYSRNTDFKWCEFEKSDGTMIKCDHWDYCLGDDDMPEPRDYEYNGIDQEPVEVEIRDPLTDDLTLSENAPSKIEE